MFVNALTKHPSNTYISGAAGLVLPRPKTQLGIVRRQNRILIGRSLVTLGDMSTGIYRDTSSLVTYLTFRFTGFLVRGPELLQHFMHSRTSQWLPACPRQLLKALESLHNAGIVHNGELTSVCYSLINSSVHAN